MDLESKSPRKSSSRRATPRRLSPIKEKKIPEYGKVINGYKITGKLGKGAYGIVYSAEKGGKSYALKKQRLIDEGDEVNGITDGIIIESDILARVGHPNVLSAVEIFMDDEKKNLYYVLEIAIIDLRQFLDPEFTINTDKLPNPKAIVDVEKLLAAKEKPTADLIISFLKQFTCGLKYLHKHHLIHADLKPANLLLFPGNVLKIADFGLVVRDLREDKTLTVQTLWWRAPEVLLGDTKYTTEADIWSLGIIAFELLFRVNPFTGSSEGQQLLKYIEEFGTPDEKVWPGVSKLSGYRESFKDLQYPRKTLEQIAGPERTKTAQDLFGMTNYNLFVAFITSCLTYDPKKRANADDLIKSPLFGKKSLCPEGRYETGIFKTKPFPVATQQVINKFLDEKKDLNYLTRLIAEDLLDRLNGLIVITEDNLLKYEIVCLALSSKLIQHEYQRFNKFTEECKCSVEELDKLEIEVFKVCNFILYTDNLIEYCDADPSLIYKYVKQERIENKLQLLKDRIRKHTYDPKNLLEVCSIVKAQKT